MAGIAVYHEALTLSSMAFLKLSNPCRPPPGAEEGSPWPRGHEWGAGARRGGTAGGACSGAMAGEVVPVQQAARSVRQGGELRGEGVWIPIGYGSWGMDPAIGSMRRSEGAGRTIPSGQGQQAGSDGRMITPQNGPTHFSYLPRLHHKVGQRCEAFSSWLEKGPPVIFWISGFFFTQVWIHTND